jgi:hypothetical protein
MESKVTVMLLDLFRKHPLHCCIQTLEQIVDVHLDVTDVV